MVPGKNQNLWHYMNYKSKCKEFIVYASQRRELWIKGYTGILQDDTLWMLIKALMKLFWPFW